MYVNFDFNCIFIYFVLPIQPNSKWSKCLNSNCYAFRSTHTSLLSSCNSVPSAQISIILNSVEYYRGWSVTHILLQRPSRVWVFVCECDNACMCVDDVLPQTQGPQSLRAKPQHHHSICDLTPANRERLPTDYITRALIAVVTVAKPAELQLRMKKPYRLEWLVFAGTD